MNYFAGELHCHTRHSDGTFTVEALCQSAKEEELNFIALTDHNTQAALPEITEALQRQTVPVLSGIEWTTFFGHMLVLGGNAFVDWRTVTPATIDRAIKKIKDTGALVGMAHPFDLGSPMCTGGHWDFLVQDWSLIDYIEVWHEDSPSVKPANLRAVAFWTELLDKGYHIAPAYGKDWHGPWDNKMQGACTYLGVEADAVTPSLMLSAIRQGRTAVTLGHKFLFRLSDGTQIFHIGDSVPAGEYHLFFSTEEVRRAQWERFNLRPMHIRVVGRGGKLLIEIPYAPQPLPLALHLEEGWLRAELWGTSNGIDCALAITGAVYINL